MATETIRLLCTGDLHLGRRPTRVPHRLDGPALSPRSVWQDTVREAIRQEVDAVVLTGDIADRENRYFEAYGAFEAGVIKLHEEDIPVVVVAGNHDSEFLPLMVADIDLDNLHFLGSEGTWERWTLEKNGRDALHFDGWSFPTQHFSNSPLDSYDLPESNGVPQVGVLHTELDSPRSQYAPVESTELRNTPTACWLLGHIHVPGIQLDADPIVLYPGSPQALDPGERGTHGPWLVSLDTDGTVGTEQLPLATVRYDEIEVDLSEIEEFEGTGAAVSSAIQEHAADELQTTNLETFLPRIKLTGRTAVHTEIRERRQELEDQLATKYDTVDIEIESVSMETRPDIDLEARANGDGPVGYLAELLLALESDEIQGESNQILEKAYDRLQQAYRGNAYNLLRRETDLGEPGREDAIDVLEQEARVLLDTLLQQKGE